MLKSTRGIKVLVDDKHVKTIPVRYVEVFVKDNSKMTFDKKRLNPDERNILEIAFQWRKYLKKVSISNRNLHHYIKNASPVDARMVAAPTRDRMELILDNKMRIEAPSEKLFKLFPAPKLIFQNY